ncbi:uncharacterized protein JCM6883_001902 [Sporobolomyces salmoneus]|uniref:uncharacterized protein n=1 Tax=Sporobolomyces salmoneus TaxID=183962 RepID=UPI003176805A
MKPNPTSTTSSSSLTTSSSRSPLPLPSTSPLVSSTTPPQSEEPSPTDLLLATPPTLLKLFSLTAPIISTLTTFCQLVTWQHDNFFASLLVLLAWWGICLFGRWIAVYGFNLSILVYISVRYFSTASKQVSSKSSTTIISSSSSATSSSRHIRPPTLTPAAYSQLLTSSHFLFSHLHSFRTTVIHPLSLYFSFTPTRPSTRAPAYTTARFALTSYPFYLILTYLIPLRYLFLVAGSIGILWNAPFFKTLRTLVWKSSTIRWIVRLVGSVCLNGGKGFGKEWDKTKKGVGIPGLLGKKRYAGIGGKKNGQGVVEEKMVKSSSIHGGGIEITEKTVIKESGVDSVTTREVEESKEVEEDVEVQFTVFENQRWWVGLDWTHALLPGERASWTDPSSNPSNPPSSFILPPAQITYLPSPTSSDPNSRLKKTTSWKWLDPEWKVLRESLPSVVLPVSVPGPLESPPSPIPASTSTTASSIFSSLPSPPSNLLSSSLSQSSAPTLQPTSFSSPASLISDQNSRLFESWSVDGEGWQYGDNHFEKMGPKGGLGKYTRRRAWVRRAGLVETTERVSGVTITTAVSEKEEKGGGKKSTTATTRRKSESKHSSSSTIEAGGGGGGKSSTLAPTTGTGQARKRKSMPPILGSEQSISKDVD